MRMDRVELGQPQMQVKVWDLPDWSNSNQSQRMGFLRNVAISSGLDPRMATFVVNILKSYNIEPRDYLNQSACLLRWVQENIYYINEPRERLQDPLYTIQVGYGDCDDMVLLLASMFTSINLDFRFVLSGKVNGKIQRWIEGEKNRSGAWVHIYIMVGNQPFNPTKWIFCEPTVKVPFGWDIVGANGVLPNQNNKNGLIELGYLGDSIQLDDQGEYSIVSEDDQTTKTGTMKKIYDSFKEELHPHKIATVVIVSAVISILTREFTSYLYKNVIRKKE